MIKKEEKKRVNFTNLMIYYRFLMIFILLFFTLNLKGCYMEIFVPLLSFKVNQEIGNY